MLYNFIKKLVKKTLRERGVDLIRFNIHTSEEVLLHHILLENKIKTVIDIGANEGQYAKGILDNGYTGHIYSFEPITSVFNKLKAAAGNLSRWKTFNLGVGSKEDELEMNISENFVSSSILPVDKASLNAQPQTRTTHTEKIKITTLDSFTSDTFISEPIYLKLDVQGYELEALKGATELLKRCNFIQVEMSFVSTYEGAPLFNDITTYLAGSGYEIFSIIPGFRDSTSGRLLQADGIFIRKENLK